MEEQEYSQNLIHHGHKATYLSGQAPKYYVMKAVGELDAGESQAPFDVEGSGPILIFTLRDVVLRNAGFCSLIRES